MSNHFKIKFYNHNNLSSIALSNKETFKENYTQFQPMVITDQN